MSKNIVVLADGTGQEGGRGHDTNVYKLFRMMEDRTERQIVFYDQGLGTDWRKVTGNVAGAGFTQNIIECYQFIFDNYNAGDKIFLFGFSRGAATVRSLASFIHYFGILPKSRPELIKKAVHLYRRGRQRMKFYRDDFEVDEEQSALKKWIDQRFHQISRVGHKADSRLRFLVDDVADNFVHNHPNQWASIEFLGVWDTVPALGLVPLAGLNALMDKLPWFRHQFHDFKLHPSIKYAYHALSIDDDRKWFFPTIWKECADWQRVQQVWFSGSHTDVGGGFREPGLSDVSLEWMVQKAVSHGLLLHLGSRKNWNFVVAPDSTDKWHPPRGSWVTEKLYKEGVRNTVWDKVATKNFGPPRVHESVFKRAKMDSAYRPWILQNYPDYDLWVLNRWLDERFMMHAGQEYQDDFESECYTQYNEGLRKLPTFAEWLAEHHPLEEWVISAYPDIYAFLQTNPNPAERKKFLEAQEDFQKWLTDFHPEYHQDVEIFGGNVFLVERTVSLYEYVTEHGDKSFEFVDLDDEVIKKRAIVKKRWIRDYDEPTAKEKVNLKGLQREDLDFLARRAVKYRGKKRIDLVLKLFGRKIQYQFNRIDNDLERWTKK